METVKCPHLVEWLDWVIFLCKAGNRPYIPDYFKLCRHCKTSDYRKCSQHVKPCMQVTDTTYPDNRMLKQQMQQLQNIQKKFIESMHRINL